MFSIDEPVYRECNVKCQADILFLVLVEPYTLENNSVGQSSFRQAYSFSAGQDTHRRLWNA